MLYKEKMIFYALFINVQMTDKINSLFTTTSVTIETP